MTAVATSSSKSMEVATCSYLPEELWERIFKFLNDDGDDKIFNNLRGNGLLDLTINDRYFKSLSAVSKQFLSITNHLRFSVKISDRTIPFLHLLFHRFPNLTSLNITLFSQCDLNALLTHISTLPLDIKSLNLYHPMRFPANGLRAFSKNMKNLTTLTCYRIFSEIDKKYLFFIADCFPLLEELILTDMGDTRIFVRDDDKLLALPKLRKIILSRNFIGNKSIDYLCKNCNLLQKIKVIECLTW